MCGRYQIKDTDVVDAYMRQVFGIPLSALFPRRFNVAPSQTIPAIALNETGSPQLLGMRWGLVPFWEKSAKPSFAPINARSEEVLNKATFKQALQKRRCLVPADGFYEWKKLEDGTKQPFAIQLRQSRPFFFAAIYENATADRPETCAFLTTRPNSLMNSIHDRMPVILDAESSKRWVASGEITAESMAAFSTPFPAEEMEAFPVSKLVNNARNEGPELLGMPDEEKDLFGSG